MYIYKKTAIRTLLVLALFLDIMCDSFAINAGNTVTLKQTTGINYSESSEIVANPERGFYYPLYFSGKLIDIKKYQKELAKTNCSIVHLRVDLSKFASGDGRSISDEFLVELYKQLDNIKRNNKTAIVRFAYSWPEVDDKPCQMPIQSMIIYHIRQLGQVIRDNQSTIMNVEAGMYGAWGEMHKSSSENYDPYPTDEVNEAIDCWLEVLPEDITVSVRTPAYYANWLGIPVKDIASYTAKSGSKEYRLGIFNDGYLGSTSDYGTFTNRTKEVNWLSKQATHTYYGGEVIGKSSGTKRTNTGKNLISEAYTTHTTYLNCEYDRAVLKSWQKEFYSKKDKLYYDPDGVWTGKSAYEYIASHLGYRLVLKDARLSPKVKTGKRLSVQCKISNVGFANIINSKKVSIVLSNKKHTYEFATDINPCEWKSKRTSVVKSSIKMTGVKKGKYKVYIRISQLASLEEDNNYQCISFANESNLYNKKLGANYIGKLVIH